MMSRFVVAMTITKEIPSEQMRSLDLHQGDSLRIVAEMEATFLIQIVKAAGEPALSKKGRAGEWARKYAGAAKGRDVETTDDARMAHYQEKYGV
jgi:antitoxin component of MazEF toxin-antitoxin module